MDVDETDLAVVHALQLSPRATWTDIGEVIGIDSTRAAQRWRRLHESGLAWAAVTPGDDIVRATVAGSAVEVHCPTHLIPQVATEVSQNPWVLSVEQVTNRCELLLEVVGGDLAHLSQIVHHEIGHLDGVEHVRMDVAAGLFVEGSAWRLDALSPQQQRRLTQLASPSTRARPASPEVTAQLSAILRNDVRTTAVEIAHQLGWSESTARRRLDQVLGVGGLRLRVDLAQPATGFPLTVTSWFRVPNRSLSRAGASVAELRHTRVCVGLASGESNLLVGSWLRSPQDVSELDIDLSAALDGARLVDRTLTVRTYKRAARLIEADGRARSLVPFSL